LSDDWRTIRETNLPAVSVTREGEWNAAGFSVVEMVRIVRQQEIRRTVSCRHGRPIRLTHDQVVNTTKHNAASSMADSHRRVLEDPEPNGVESFSNLLRIAPEVIVIAHAAPGAQ